MSIYRQRMTFYRTGNLDALYGVSIAVIDGKVGQTIGITLPNLGVSIYSNDVNFRDYKFINDINIQTLDNLKTTSFSRLNVFKSDVFNLGTTMSTHDTRLDLIDINLINDDTCNI